MFDLITIFGPIFSNFCIFDCMEIWALFRFTFNFGILFEFSHFFFLRYFGWEFILNILPYLFIHMNTGRKSQFNRKF